MIYTLTVCNPNPLFVEVINRFKVLCGGTYEEIRILIILIVIRLLKEPSSIEHNKLFAINDSFKQKKL